MAPVATRALVLQLAPLPLLVVRMGVAAVVLLPWCGPVLRGPGRQYVPRLIVAGLLGMVGYNLPVTIGLQWVPASTAGLVLASEPVWLLLLAAAFLGERVSRRSWAGAAVALAGVAVLAGPGVLSSRRPLRARCYRSGTAAAARSRAADPAMTRAHPAAILGLRRCTARATQGT